MNSTTLFKYTAILFLSCLFLSCNNTNKTESKETEKAKDAPSQKFQNKGHELVYNMVQKVGDYETLTNKRNVSYTYTYQTPDEKKDVSNERYIFDGELSYGKYNTHEKTLPQLDGVIEQGYGGNEFWLKQNGEILTDPALLKAVAFNRPTNFYWFTMMQKLMDPGVNYEHLGEKTIADQEYDIVKISFESKDDKPTDIYQLYINKKTAIVDQFLFTVADFGAMETPFLMQLEYKNVDGILIPAKRQYKKSTWDAEVTDQPWVYVNWTDIKFNTDLTKKDFKKESQMQ